MITITKQFSFSYGHRVHSQKLNQQYSIDAACSCKHLHGHNAKIEVTLTASSLDSTGMITDFKHLNWFKKWVDDTLDHKMILDINDPLVGIIFPLRNEIGISGSNEYGYKPYYRFDLERYPVLTPPEVELYGGVVFVSFVPTSENLAKWLGQICKCEISKGEWENDLKVHSITFQETDKSSCTVTL